ncbi:MAG TPA: DNA repair protein RadA [Acidimicrobiales bacterium]|nr:DNA repair protein RadA [Acidimicrobiales bacterium]
MARARTLFRCTDCGVDAPKWTGQCASCGEWNTLVEEVDRPGAPAAWTGPAAEPVPLERIETAASRTRASGLAELDRVLGGGFVQGSVTLLGGEPGIGKSTLTLQLLASVAAAGGRGLLVSAEESVHQVQLRAERLGAKREGVWVVAETSVPAILAASAELKPDVLVVDSIQTVFDPEIGSAPGSVAQVRECAHALVVAAKAGGPATVLVGHVTKEGALAGPRVLEHVVDTVLSFDGDRHHALRMLRAVKHRFGPTGELGLFEMAEAGLVAVPDPGALFLGDRRVEHPGSAVVPVLEGQRTLLVEVQGLVASTAAITPRRSAQGIDFNRLSVLLAVLEDNAKVVVSKHEVYASAVGGVRVNEPAADLAIALAVASSKMKRALPPDLVACGEIGLGGELRQVNRLAARLNEAARFGFRRALVPASSPDVAGIELVRVASLAEAIRLLATS